MPPSDKTHPPKGRAARLRSGPGPDEGHHRAHPQQSGGHPPDDLPRRHRRRGRGPGESDRRLSAVVN